jgi:hypothetical protein
MADTERLTDHFVQRSGRLMIRTASQTQWVAPNPTVPRPDDCRHVAAKDGFIQLPLQHKPMLI